MLSFDVCGLFDRLDNKWSSRSIQPTGTHEIGDECPYALLCLDLVAQNACQLGKVILKAASDLQESAASEIAKVKRPFRLSLKCALPMSAFYGQ